MSKYRAVAIAYGHILTSAGLGENFKESGCPWEMNDDIPDRHLISMAILDSDALNEVWLHASLHLLQMHGVEWVVHVAVSPASLEDPFFADLASSVCLSRNWIYLDLQHVSPRGLNLYRRRFGRLFPALLDRKCPSRIAYRCEVPIKQ